MNTVSALTNLDAAQGAGEARSEAYLTYAKRALELATQRCAKKPAEFRAPHESRLAGE